MDLSTPTTTQSRSSPSLPGLSEPVSRADHRSTGPLPQEEIEKLADRLLADSVAAIGRGDYPFYSESWLRQLEDRDRTHPILELEGDPCLHDPKALVYRLLRRTAISVRQRRVVQLTVSGLKPHQVAHRMHFSETTARSELSAAICELARVAAGDGHLPRREQIRQVLHDEQHRRPPDKLCPEHCRQPCKRSGKCPFRWYLHV